jgi:hypothetical protein
MWPEQLYEMDGKCLSLAFRSSWFPKRIERIRNLTFQIQVLRELSLANELLREIRGEK